MIVFKTYSILMVTIFILSLRKLHATPPIPPEIQQNIDNCVDRIYNAFGGGDTREHGKVAIDHFVHIPASNDSWDPYEGEYPKEACHNTITHEYDSGDLLGYYLSFKEHLDVGDIPEYLTFCEEIIPIYHLKIDEDNCIDVLKSYFENDRYKDLIKIFYKINKYQINPKFLTKTIDYKEDPPVVTKRDGDVVYEYREINEVVTKKRNGEIVLKNPDGKEVTLPSPNTLTVKPNNEIEIHLLFNDAFITIPRGYANFDPEEEDPPNTVNIGVLYIDRVKETYGLDIDAMPPPEEFCKDKYNPKKK